MIAYEYLFNGEMVILYRISEEGNKTISNPDPWLSTPVNEVATHTDYSFDKSEWLPFFDYFYTEDGQGNIEKISYK